MSHFTDERNRLGYSQEFLAEQLEVNRKTISRWEKGTPIPSDKLEVCHKLGFDLVYVVTGNRSTLEVVEQPTIDVDAAVDAAVYAVEEAILSVYQVKKLRKELGPGGGFDAIKTLSTIKKATQLLTRAELTGELNPATIREVFELANEA